MNKMIYLTAAAILGAAFAYADEGQESGSKMRRQPASNKYGARMTEGFFVTGDFLYWIAHEEGLEYAITGIKGPSNPDPTPVRRGSTKNVHFQWDPGFRVGIGYTVGKSFWDLGLTWTRYHTHAHGSSSHPSNEQPSLNPLLSVLEHPGFLNDLGDFEGLLSSASAKLRLNYDTVDLELSRNFYPNRYLAIKPHVGVRGAWIKQRYSNIYTFVDSTASNNAIVARKLKNNYWAAGFKTGLDSLWSFNRYFGIYGNASVTLVGGKFHIAEKDTVLSTTLTSLNTFIDINDHFFSVQPALEAALGFHFLLGPDNKHWRFELNAGWEYLLWFNQNQMPLFVDSQSLGTMIRERGNLQLMGGTINAKLHF